MNERETHGPSLPVDDGTPVVGWREWVSLPEIGKNPIKAKVDTGARSSSLHATEIQRFERDGRQWVGFTVLPWQGSDLDAIATEAPLHGTREVRSSTGHSRNRAVIKTSLLIGSHSHMIELTLTDRSEMGFRLLVGREAIRGRYLVDSGRSYLEGKPPKRIRRRNRQSSP